MFESKIIAKSNFRRKNCQMSHFWKKMEKKWEENGRKMEKKWEKNGKKWGKARLKLDSSFEKMDKS